MGVLEILQMMPLEEEKKIALLTAQNGHLEILQMMLLEEKKHNINNLMEACMSSTSLLLQS